MIKNFKFSLFLFPFLMNFLSISCVVAASVETIPVKGEPIALAVDEESGRLFSLNFFNKTLSVIDEKKLKVVRTIELRKRISPNVGTRAILYDSSLNVLFISTGGGEVLILNASSFKLTGEIRIERFISDLASDGDSLYLPDWSGNIHKYRGQVEDALIRHGYAASPYMHFGRDKRIYLSLGRKGLLVIDAEKEEVLKKLEIDAYSTPASSGDYIFAAGPGKLYIIDSLHLELENIISIDYGNSAGLGLVYNPLNGYVYVVTEDNTVTLANPRIGKIVRKINVCERPKSLTVNNKTGVVYVACPAGNTVHVISD